MIVWGGQNPGFLNDGGRYNPTSNSWTPTGKTPTPRRYHAAVWTGSEMIIWGGIVPFNIDPALSIQTLAGNTIRARIAGRLRPRCRPRQGESFLRQYGQGVK